MVTHTLHPSRQRSRGRLNIKGWSYQYMDPHGPLARYVKLRVADAPGMPGTFSPPPRASDPDMHHGTCVTHVPWCMPGSLTSGQRSRGRLNIKGWSYQYMDPHGPLAWYVKLRVVHAPGMPGTFSPPPRASDPDMHHGTCVTHVPWCMPGSLTSGLLWSQWWGKRSRHSRRMRNPQFYASGKRPMFKIRRSHDRLIFKMGIPIPRKDGFYIEAGPDFFYLVSALHRSFTGHSIILSLAHLG